MWTSGLALQWQRWRLSSARAIGQSSILALAGQSLGGSPLRPTTAPTATTSAVRRLLLLHHLLSRRCPRRRPPRLHPCLRSRRLRDATARGLRSMPALAVSLGRAGTHPPTGLSASTFAASGQRRRRLQAIRLRLPRPGLHPSHRRPCVSDATRGPSVATASCSPTAATSPRFGHRGIRAGQTPRWEKPATGTAAAAPTAMQTLASWPRSGSRRLIRGSTARGLRLLLRRRPSRRGRRRDRGSRPTCRRRRLRRPSSRPKRPRARARASSG